MSRVLIYGAGAVAVVLVAAGCGGSKSPAVRGSGSARGGYAAALAYSRCMRRHGIRDFPDPTSSSGGTSFEIQGGQGSDLGRNSPAFVQAGHACRTLLPGGRQGSPPAPGKISEEVRWAHCMRSHGLSGFPDPNAQGAFDSSKFDDHSPAFETASDACKALETAMGAVSAVPGHG